MIALVVTVVVVIECGNQSSSICVFVLLLPIVNIRYYLSTAKRNYSSSTIYPFQVEGWTDLQDRLDSLGFAMGSRIYTILFIFLGHFIFTNVFVGVIIMNISEATETYQVGSSTWRVLYCLKDGLLYQAVEYIKLKGNLNFIL